MHKSIALAGALLLAACQSTDTPSQAAPTAVTPFLGKTLVADGGTTFIFNDDGTVSGKFRGEADIVGTYSATATEICSSYTAPDNFVDIGEICSVPDIKGDTVIFTRRNGSQSPPYKITG